MVKNLPAVQETWVRSLGREDSLEKGLATHCNMCAWRIPGRLQSMGSESQHKRVTSTTNTSGEEGTLVSVPVIPGAPRSLHHSLPQLPATSEIPGPSTGQSGTQGTHKCPLKGLQGTPQTRLLPHRHKVFHSLIHLFTPHFPSSFSLSHNKISLNTNSSRDL